MVETSILPEEAERFGALAHDWWDPDGSSAMLHRLNPVRLKYLRDQVDRHWQSDECSRTPLEGKSALDVGCGAGLLAEPLARLGARVTGIDAAPEVIEVARAHAAGQGLAIDYRAGDIQGLDGRFDLVTCMEVVEHVADPRAFSRACASVLRPGGVFLGLTVNKYHYFGFATWATCRLGVTDRTLAMLDHAHHHGHDHHVPTVYRMNSPGQVSGHLQAAGFASVDYRMFDKPELYAWYLPRVLSPWPRAWSAAAYHLGNPYLMGHLAFRAVRGTGGPDEGTMSQAG